jgi:hypothetical protein
MNRINVKRLLLSGVITLLVFIIIEFVLERIIGQVLFAGVVEEWYRYIALPHWGMANSVINIFIALVNCMILMWLYAALRPMFGVGTKTALITSAFFLTFISSFAFNQANLGIFPLRVALIELFYQFVELPLALIAGAQFYEAG